MIVNFMYIHVMNEHAAVEHFHAASITILKCGRAVMPSSGQCEDRAPADFWCGFWNRNSRMEIRWKQDRFELSSQHLILVTPHTPYRMVRYPDEKKTTERQWEHYFFHFRVYAGHVLPPRGAFRIPCDCFMVESLTRLENLAGTDEDNTSDAPLLLSIIAQALARLPDTFWQRSPYDTRIQRIIDYIDANLSEKLSNRELAVQANISVETLAREFRRQIGVSPHRFVLDRRLRHARHLLATTELSLDEIAFQCGFCDRFHLTRVFSEALHRSPVAFRKEFRYRPQE
ncbi:MAG: helix-turn-helix domain-containing protein [Lentisphaerae bacterium]|nr:MAG: helix-turn-helix domain-containing protein [Lentisphaerota bacterium]